MFLWPLKALLRIYVNKIIELPIRSFAVVPKNSPRIVTLVPGGPSFGDIPVTTGGGPILNTRLVCNIRCYNNYFRLKIQTN